MRHFEPKIIIGSIAGFLFTIITLISIFFPSLLNMEKKNINNININLSSNNSFLDLYDFLKDHQQEYVNLNIHYTEKIRQVISYFENDSITIKDIPLNIGTSEKNCLGRINKYFYVVSYGILNTYNKIFVRNYGYLGFFIGVEDKYIPFLLLIPYDSRSGLKYKWESITNSINDMLLSGYFYVHDFTTQFKPIENINVFFPKEYNPDICNKFTCMQTIICELEPVLENINDNY